MNYKKNLIEICSVINKQLCDLKILRLFSHIDLEEITNEWSEEECQTICLNIIQSINIEYALHDVHINPWCVKNFLYGLGDCKDCKFGKRNKLCYIKNSSYYKTTSKLFKLYDCEQIIDISNFLDKIKNFIDDKIDYRKILKDKIIQDFSIGYFIYTKFKNFDEMIDTMIVFTESKTDNKEIKQSFGFL